jgi:hypothetical protein
MCSAFMASFQKKTQNAMIREFISVKNAKLGLSMAIKKGHISKFLYYKLFLIKIINYVKFTLVKS